MPCTLGGLFTLATENTNYFQTCMSNYSNYSLPVSFLFLLLSVLSCFLTCMHWSILNQRLEWKPHLQSSLFSLSLLSLPLAPLLKVLLSGTLPANFSHLGVPEFTLFLLNLGDSWALFEPCAVAWKFSLGGKLEGLQSSPHWFPFSQELLSCTCYPMSKTIVSYILYCPLSQQFFFVIIQ